MEVIVIGTGNLGYHLCKAIEGLYLSSKNIHLTSASCCPTSQIFLKGYYNHTGYDISGINALRIHDLNGFIDCDLVIIATPDDLVPQISGMIKTRATVVHTSGSVNMNSLNAHKDHGVLYFPQSFSKTRKVDFSTIPCCIEYHTILAQEKLICLGSSLSRKQYHINSKQRQQLHKAAVFMNNFVNHCYTLSMQLLDEGELPHELLEPLMKETLEKAIDIGSFKAQTGPALRGDWLTMNSHTASLSTDIKAVYQAMSQSIINTYKNEL